uniref:Uncharacterized protein n=1 Tax=Arundo donax TaxID=35708 RepID=A0A0A9GFH8_ARUDO
MNYDLITENREPQFLSRGLRNKHIVCDTATAKHDIKQQSACKARWGTNQRDQRG